ncbi:MAG: hypothetical protein R3C16_09150 [Hyphomonadaceae bacterium]
MRDEIIDRLVERRAASGQGQMLAQQFVFFASGASKLCVAASKSRMVEAQR